MSRPQAESFTILIDRRDGHSFKLNFIQSDVRQ